VGEAVGGNRDAISRKKGRKESPSREESLRRNYSLISLEKGKEERERRLKGRRQNTSARKKLNEKGKIRFLLA